MFEFILGLIVGGAGVWFLTRKRDSTAHRVGGLQNDRAREEKRKNLDKVLTMAREKGEIRNDDVENALGVSDATAERYLNELEKLGKLEQVGDAGRQVYYRLRPE